MLAASPRTGVSLLTIANASDRIRDSVRAIVVHLGVVRVAKYECHAYFPS